LPARSSAVLKKKLRFSKKIGGLLHKRIVDLFNNPIGSRTSLAFFWARALARPAKMRFHKEAVAKLKFPNGSNQPTQPQSGSESGFARFEYGCFGKEFDSEFDTFLTAPRLPCVARSWVSNPSHTMNRRMGWKEPGFYGFFFHFFVRDVACSL
jgi:hypothetical protein